VSQALLNRRGDDANVLTKDALLEVMDLHESIESIQSKGATEGYDSRTCALVFWRAEGAEPCAKESILAFWDYNRTLLRNDPDVADTVNRRENQLGECCSPRNRRFVLSSYASKIGRDPVTNRVTKIGALSNTYFLRQDLHTKSRRDPDVYRLEQKFDRVVRRQNLPSFERPMALTPAGANENVDAVFDFDRLVITLAFVVICSYAFFALTRWKRRLPASSFFETQVHQSNNGHGDAAAASIDDASKTDSSLRLLLARGSLGLQAVLVVACAVASAWGVVFAFALEATPLASVAAFLVLGIGLDDAFVIIGAVDDDKDFDDDAQQVAECQEEDKERLIAELAARRACRAMAVAGPSITTTSVTDAAAFYAGSYTQTPAIHSFCIFAATSVVVDFLLQVTFFVALYVLDARKKLRTRAQQLKRDDGVSSSKADAVLVDDDDDEEQQQQRPAGQAPASNNGESAKAYALEDMLALAREDKAAEKNGASLVDKEWYGRVYAKYLLSPFGIAFVFATTATIVTLAAIGCARYDMHFSYNWFYVKSMKNGYVVRSDNFQRKFFPALGAGEDSATSFNLYTKHADYFALEDQMQSLLRRYGQLSFVDAASLESNWWSAHRAWAANTTIASSEEYVLSVAAFVGTEDGAAYGAKIVFDDPDAPTAILATEIESFWEESKSTQQSINWMRAARRRVKDAAPQLRPVLFATVFVWLEGLAIVTVETVRALAIACSVVVVVLVCLLGDLAVAALVAAFVASICICTFGSIYWYGDHLNFISAFFVVVSVGLATDASAHIAHAYINAPPSLRTGPSRAAYALARIGSAVFRGNFSTLLGVLVIGLARGYVFKTFFWYLTTIMVLAIWFGLAVAPCALAVLGPLLVSTPSNDDPDDDDDKTNARGGSAAAEEHTAADIELPVATHDE